MVKNLDKFGRGDRVEIYWTDSSEFPGWKPHEFSPDTKEMEVLTIAIFVELKDNHVLVCRDMSVPIENKDGEINGVFMIPIGCMQKIRKLK